MYSRDVVFIEVRGKSEPEEFVQTKNNLDTVQLELRNEEDDSNESTKPEEKVEKLTSMIRRLERIRKPVERYSPFDFCSAFILTSIDDETKSDGEEVDSTECKLWKDAMVEEIESLYKNETWDLVKLPSGINPIDRKWVFKKKMNPTRQVKKIKARPVVTGYSQVQGVDFGEIVSPVEKLTSIRVLMYLATKFYLEIEQMDVKTMFLHGDWEE
jgi:hypothetical protein